MRTRLAAMLILVCVLGSMPGCGYRRAMNRAERHVESEQWREAVVEYRNALKRKPDSPDAQAGLDAVRIPALHDTVAAARAALPRGEYETAMDHAAFAGSLDDGHASVQRLRGDVLEAMRGDLDDRIDSGEMERAYALADRIGALFPTAPFLHDVYDQLREHFFERADMLLEEGRFAAALEQLALVEIYEPDLGDEVETRARVIRTAWAEDLTGSAADRESAGHRGAAAALLATAHQVAGREEDLARGLRLAHRLQLEGRFSVSLRTAGDPARIEWALDPAAEGIAAISGADAVGEEQDAWLVWTLSAGETGCDQTNTVIDATQDYVAGQLSTDNPDYLVLLEHGDEIRRDLDETVVELAGARADLERTSLKTGTHEIEVMRPLWDEIQVLRYELQRLEGDPVTHPEIARVMEDLELLIEEEEEAAADHRRLRAASDGARYQLELLVQQDADLRVSQANNDAVLGQTPPLLFEDIIESFPYEIHQWTRACTTELRVDARGSWGDGVERTRVHSSTSTTVDRANDAFPDYGVTGDPLEFEVNEDGLVARADLENIQRALTDLSATADEFYAHTWAEALSHRTTDPDHATDAMLRFLLAAPSRLGERDRALIADHVLRVYGLEDLSALE